VRDEFGTPRRTEIVDGGADMEDEDLIQREDMVVTVTHEGYIKRVPLSIYRAQARGGKGRSGMTTKDEDFVTRLFVANTHTPILFFSSRGIVYKEKVWRLPIGTPQSQAASSCATCCRWKRATASPRSCRCRTTRRVGQAST
jgi:DNA gyrase subunit A